MIVNTLHISFSPLLSLDEVPKFRGAVLNALSGESDVLLHNHIDDNFRYDYPLVQYKSIAAKASIFCVGEGVELLGRLMNLCNSKLHIGPRPVTLQAEKVVPCQTEVALGEPQRYRIEQWLPLNSDNDTRFTSLRNDAERNDLLEHILVGNILSMAKGLGILFDGRVECEIRNLDRYRQAWVKGVTMNTFDAEFICNVNLPDLIGLGKHASFGYGTIRRLV